MDPSPCTQPSPEALRSLIARGPSADAAKPLLSLRHLAGLAVERMHFPGTKPVQLQIRAWDQGGQSQTLLGEWVGEAAADLAATEIARLAKSRRGKMAQDTVVVADAAHGLLLRRPGFDAKLPGLRLLHDAGFARESLGKLGCDGHVSVTLVTHRLGKRAVLRITAPDGTRYARLRPVTSDSGQVAFEQHQALWQALEGSPNLAIPRPLAFDAGLGLALFAALPGEPPRFQGLDGFRATQSVLAAVLGLQALRIAAPLHGVAEELAILQGWASRLTDVFPDLAARLHAPLDRLQHDMTAVAPLAAVPCHRDLHEGQILLDQTLAGLLDFDTLRLGDPALDVGNLQAHLVLASLRDGRSRRGFTTAMDNGLPQLSIARIALWRRAALLRLALIYAFTAEPRTIIHGLLDEAA